MDQNWEEVQMADGQVYFYNKELDVTVWQKPEGMDSTAGTLNQTPQAAAFVDAQKYFNITTTEVRQKILVSIMPHWIWKGIHGASSGLYRDNIDLYGPFWITQTLCFTFFFAGHLSSLISLHQMHSHYGTMFVAWVYIMTWWLCSPFMIQLGFTFIPSPPAISYVEFLSVCGYSLIPACGVALLSSIITIKMLQLLLCVAGIGWSVWYVSLVFQNEWSVAISRREKGGVLMSLILVEALVYLAIPLYFLSTAGVREAGPQILSSGGGHHHHHGAAGAGAAGAAVTHVIVP